MKNSTLFYSILLYSTLFVQLSLNAQSWCPTSGSSSSNKSNTCDVDLDDITVKTIKVTFHVFQDNNGQNNIPNNSAGNSFLDNLLGRVNTRFANLEPMNLSTSPPSPYFQDSKIRFKKVNTYFWQDDFLWSKGDNRSGHNSVLKNFVFSQNIQHKYSSIHVFLPGNFTSADDGLGEGQGRACGIPCMQFNMLEDIYYYYTNGGNWWDSGNVLGHEFGHNLGLRHTVEPTDPSIVDPLDDTPIHTPCWNGPSCSNNVMDYNAHQGAMTLDQVSVCHKNISENIQYLYSGIQSGNLSISLSNSNNNGPVGCCTINTGSSSATVNVNAPNTSSFQWTQTGGSGNINYSVLNNGKKVNLSGLGSIYFTVTWVENCIEYSRSLVFFNGGYYYSVSPNPTTGKIVIKGNKERLIPSIDPNGVVTESPATFDKIKIYSSNTGNLILNKKYPDGTDLASIQLDGAQPGQYSVIVQSRSEKIQFQIIKQ